MPQPLPDQALDQLFREARTFNTYLDKPVAPSLLRQVWDLMKMGPTSMNQLPARLVWCTSQDAKERLASHCMDSNAVKVRKAPVAVILAMDTNFHEDLPELFPANGAGAAAMFAKNEAMRHESAFRNSTLQGAYFILAARSLGLSCGPMSGFDNEGVEREFLGDQPGWKSNFIATLGYGDPQTLYPRGPRPDFERYNSLL